MSSSDTRDKAIRLFQYLREVSDLRSRPVLHHRQYERTIWVADILQDQAFPDAESSDGWFAVDRVALPDRPPSPAALTDWIDEWDLDDWRSEPQLKSTAEIEITVNDDIEGSYTKATVVSRSSRPEVDEAWASYSQVWQAWQAECKELEPAHQAYTTMFTAYQRAESLGEQFELVLGVGLLAWSPAKDDIARHLVTAACTMHLESSTGQIVLRPDEDAPRTLNFEQDMVAPEMRPSSRDVGDLQERALEVGDPLNTEGVSELLRSWVHAADPDGAFTDTWDRANLDGQARVTMSPAICLRKRSQSGLQTTYESILKQLADETVPIPATSSPSLGHRGWNGPTCQ